MKVSSASGRKQWWLSEADGSVYDCRILLTALDAVPIFYDSLNTTALALRRDANLAAL